MKITTKDTKVYDLEYTDWMSDSQVYMVMTEWTNGEGFEIDIEGKGVNKHFALSNNEMNALFILYGKSGLNEKDDDEEKTF